VNGVGSYGEAAGRRGRGGVESSGGEKRKEKRNELDPDRQMDHGHDGCLGGGGGGTMAAVLG
jgi:hypothetical protein